MANNKRNDKELLETIFGSPLDTVDDDVDDIFGTGWDNDDEDYVDDEEDDDFSWNSTPPKRNWGAILLVIILIALVVAVAILVGVMYMGQVGVQAQPTEMPEEILATLIPTVDPQVTNLQGEIGTYDQTIAELTAERNNLASNAETLQSEIDALDIQIADAIVLRDGAKARLAEVEADLATTNSTIASQEVVLVGRQTLADANALSVAHENVLNFSNVFSEIPVASVYFQELSVEPMVLYMSVVNLEADQMNRYLVEAGVAFTYCDTTFNLGVNLDTNEVTANVVAIGELTLNRAYVQDHAMEIHPREVYLVDESQIAILDQETPRPENTDELMRTFVLVEVIESDFRCQSGLFQDGNFPTVGGVKTTNENWLQNGNGISLGYHHITDLRSGQ